MALQLMLLLSGGAVAVLYFVSLCCVLIGAWILILVLFEGSINIENSRLIVLGIVLFIPLRFLKKYLEKYLAQYGKDFD